MKVYIISSCSEDGNNYPKLYLTLKEARLENRKYYNSLMASSGDDATDNFISSDFDEFKIEYRDGSFIWNYIFENNL